MIEIKGIVIVASKEQDGNERVVLYGKNVNLSGNQTFENFTTNGLEPFPNVPPARLSLDELCGDNFYGYSRFGLAKVKIGFGENRTNSELKGKTNLIIIGEADKQIHLFGPCKEGAENTCDQCATIQTNGFRRFTSFEKVMAMYGPYWELQRQGRFNVSLATFSMRRINL